MNPAFDPLRRRGWRNPQFQHDMGSPFQLPHQTTHQTFVPPPPMPLPPPIPPTFSLPITYYDTNGPFYHASQYSAVHSPCYENMDYYASDPQQNQPGYYEGQFSVPPIQNTGYQVQDSRNPAYGPNPLYLWQGPPSHHQDVNDQEGPPTEHHDEEPRGRKRHSRSQSRRIQSKDRAHDEAHHPLGPSTPKRGFSRAASRRRQSQPHSEKILQSAKRILLKSPWKSGPDEKNESEEKYRYEDQDRMGTYPGQETQEHRHFTRPTTPPATNPLCLATSRKHKARHHSTHARRPSQTTCPQPPRRGHRAHSRNHSAEKVRPMQTRDTGDPTGDRPDSKSDLSDLDGNLDISKMNGLLDIWDSTGNPNWEKETFALCDLEHCRRCGKYYVLMRTLRHKCRR